MDSTAPRRDVAELEAALEAALERQRELEGDLRRAAVRQHQGEHLLDAAPVAIVVSDEAGIIRYANHRTAELFGYEPAELVGQELEKLVPSRFAESHRRYRDLYFGNPRLRAMKNARELVARHRDGREFPVDISLSPLETATGMVVSAAISDITDRKRVEDALIHQALHDSLTGLPNRTLLMDRLEQALARRSRHSGRVAVLFVDIDRFKWVNDSLGHMAGDAVLAEVGNRLQSSAREGDTAARVGGDEFVVVCEDVESEADAVKLAERCAGAISVPIPVYGAVLRPTVSIGIALSTTGEDTDP
ncbi:MAG TPA: sensor domain-containing diguanylate cyclase, partial [Acidimicrobiales bacterium]|nr:sensor domain-containing diguanylate cyclase [Acidimicrobiales bacterium]